jgi:putative transposase
MNQSNSLVPVCPAFAVRGQLRTQRGLPFAEHLPASLIHSLGHQFGIVFRKRIFTPAVTLWTFLSQVLDHDHSCRQAVARLLAYRTAHGLSRCSADTGAYCKARARLPEELLAELTRHTGRQLAQQAPARWLWHGRPVKIVDGTGLSMPDTAKNAKAFPKSKRFRPGMGFPVMRLVVVFSLAVGTVLEAAFGPAKGKGTGELSLFRQLANQFQRGDVLLGDRLYGSYWNIAQALAKGVDVVVRLYGCRIPISFVGQRDDNRRVCWQKPIRPPWMSLRDYQRLPCQLVLRAVRVRVSQVGFRTRQLVLITTLTDAAAVSGASLADLYRRRWQAELHLRSLKQTLQMDILRGRSPAMVRKEVWAHLLVYNLVRVVMAQAAVADALRPDEISFTGALQTINGFLPEMRATHTPEQAQVLWEVLLWAVAEHRVGHRPDRYEPRAVKRHPKAYPRLTVSRAQARRYMRQQLKSTATKC